VELFTVSLVKDGVGMFDLGFIDSTKYTGSIAHTPVVLFPNPPNTGEWSLISSGYAIGGYSFNTTSIPVLTNTGTNVVTTNYYHHVYGASQQSYGNWAFPCSSTLPTFTFGVGSSSIVIPAKLCRHLVAFFRACEAEKF
jgi:hypothetical protein